MVNIPSTRLTSIHTSLFFVSVLLVASILHEGYSIPNAVIHNGKRKLLSINDL